MADADDVIPAPTSLPEVGIHLSYIRRDIRKVGSAVEEGFRALDDHYVSRAEFEPVSADVKANKLEIGNIKEWKDNLSGKLIGFGAGLALASSGLTAALSHFIGG